MKRLLIIIFIILSIKYAFAHTEGKYPEHSEETLKCINKCVKALEIDGGTYANGGVSGYDYVSCYIANCNCIIEYGTGDLHCAEKKEDLNDLQNQIKLQRRIKEMLESQNMYLLSM